MPIDQLDEHALRMIIRDEIRLTMENSIALVQEETDDPAGMARALYILETIHLTTSPSEAETLEYAVEVAMGEVQTAVGVGAFRDAIDHLRDLADFLERSDIATSSKETPPPDEVEWAALQEEDETLAPPSDHHSEFRRSAGVGPFSPRSVSEAGEEGARGGHSLGDDHLDEEPPSRTI